MFSKKFHSRVPSKRVAMVSRKVFCGARRPFITGIFTLMRDRQQLAEGHTIPEAQRAAFRGGLRSSRRALWGQQSRSYHRNLHLQPLCSTRSRARASEAGRAHPNTCGGRFRSFSGSWF